MRGTKGEAGHNTKPRAGVFLRDGMLQSSPEMGMGRQSIRY